MLLDNYHGMAFSIFIYGGGNAYPPSWGQGWVDSDLHRLKPSRFSNQIVCYQDIVYQDYQDTGYH